MNFTEMCLRCYLHQYKYYNESESTTLPLINWFYSQTGQNDFGHIVTSKRKIFYKSGNWNIFLGTTGLKYRNPDTQVSINWGFLSFRRLLNVDEMMIRWKKWCSLLLRRMNRGQTMLNWSLDVWKWPKNNAKWHSGSQSLLWTSARIYGTKVLARN